MNELSHSIRGLKSKFMIIILTMLVVIACDQVTKKTAEKNLKFKPAASYVFNTLRLQYAENRGAMLSLGSSLPERARFIIFTLGVAVTLLILTVYTMASKALSSVEFASLCLIISGGFSNLIDRFSHGFVVDFLNMGIGWLRTGIFNVADLAITTGITIMLLRGIILHFTHKQPDQLP